MIHPASLIHPLHAAALAKAGAMLYRWFAGYGFASLILDLFGGRHQGGPPDA